MSYKHQKEASAEIESIFKLKMGCLTLLTEVTGKAVVQVLVELGAMSPFQSCAEPEVRQLYVALQPKTQFHQALVNKHV